jgi:hypothetical protein
LSRPSSSNQPVQLALDPTLEELSEDEISTLKSEIMKQVGSLKLPSWADGTDAGLISKDAIRAMHAAQRRDILNRELSALRDRLPAILSSFAQGSEVIPDRIDPVLVPVKSEGPNADLFRFATLLWSVPVSKGYGRRMRFLVRDQNNGKLIGVFGLTDPVFNLRVRDDWIGWDSERRRAALVHVMDAYVVGAVPPYSNLIGGKMVASLIGSSEVGEAFAQRYSETSGHISKERKSARLAAVTVTSALGRSSLYNRLRLFSPAGPAESRRLLVELIHLGSTRGYGHFHLSERLFRDLRRLVKSKGHDYASAYRFGDGPNWRIRLARVGLGMLGFDPDFLRHGVTREVYAMPLATNYRKFLSGEEPNAHLDRPSTSEIASAALDRWILPRAARDPSFAAFERSQLMELIQAKDPGPVS